MNGLSAFHEKKKMPSAGLIVFLASLGMTLGLVITPVTTEAAPTLPEPSAAKVIKNKGTALAAQDPEETGSIQANSADDSSCSRSRKRLFVEGEGWIVRRVTTCY